MCRSRTAACRTTSVAPSRSGTASCCRRPRALPRAWRSMCGQDVIGIDRNAKEVEVRDLQEGRTYRESYDKLVLCPGAHPIRPPIPGGDDPRVDVLRNIPDMDRILAKLENGTSRAVRSVCPPDDAAVRYSSSMAAGITSCGTPAARDARPQRGPEPARRAAATASSVVRSITRPPITGAWSEQRFGRPAVQAGGRGFESHRLHRVSGAGQRRIVPLARRSIASQGQPSATHRSQRSCHPTAQRSR
jgi:Pyridine nucleotide-disulphide oxidoreductase